MMPTWRNDNIACWFPPLLLDFRAERCSVVVLSERRWETVRINDMTGFVIMRRGTLWLSVWNLCTTWRLERVMNGRKDKGDTMVAFGESGGTDEFNGGTDEFNGGRDGFSWCYGSLLYGLILNKRKF